MTQEEFDAQFISQQCLTDRLRKSNNYFNYHIPRSFPEPLKLKVGTSEYKLYYVDDIKHNKLVEGIL